MLASKSYRFSKPFRKNNSLCALQVAQPFSLIGKKQIKKVSHVPYALSQQASNQALEVIRNESTQILQGLQSTIVSRNEAVERPEAVKQIQQNLKEKLKYSIANLQKGLVERDTEVRLLLLATVAGEHILLIGPPGTAKSEVGRRLSRFVKGNYFERLLTRFSVPEELFGPLSMRALEEDRYVRQTRGYLPEAEVAFIDEIFKANSAILNSLLTLLNERLFDNGSSRDKVPLVTLVGASNELPEGEELEALFDRFLLRRRVSQVTPAGLSQMLSYFGNGVSNGSGISNHVTNSISNNNEVKEGSGFGLGLGRSISPSSPSSSNLAQAKLSLHDVRECRRQALKTVRVPESILQSIVDLRDFLQTKLEPPVYVSDRRVLKAMQLLQVAAFCDNRSEVNAFDLLILQHVFWRQPDQAGAVAEWLTSQLTVDFGAKQIQFLLSALFARVCKVGGGGGGGLTGTSMAAAAAASPPPPPLSTATAFITTSSFTSSSSSSTSSTSRIEAIQKEATQLRELICEKLIQSNEKLLGANELWIGSEAAALAVSLEPRLARTRERLYGALRDVVLLEGALKHDLSPVTLAALLPKQWAEFIRNSDVGDVMSIGTVPLPKATPQKLGSWFKD